MADHALPIGPNRVTTDSWIEVRSPYDDSLVARVPEASKLVVEEAVERCLARHQAGPLPAWQRAEILDRAAVAVAAHEEELARIISAEAAKPIKTARIEAQRCVSTFQFAAVAARTLAGEVVP